MTSWKSYRKSLEKSAR